jgi:tripartite-type tricarboxylate transporter receptor subunit TctC
MKVAADVQQALRAPDVQKKMEGYGVDVQFMGPDRFGAYMKAEAAKWAKVIKAGKIEQQ